eukprot:jgi/Psemu1/316025/fgenesh1_kg.2684_\
MGRSKAKGNGNRMGLAAAASPATATARTLVAILAVLFSSTTTIVCEASITLMNSGRTYRSRMDYQIGQPFLSEFDYVGRLQVLPENPTLCPDPNDPDKKHKVVRPSDGLPVALMAQAGGCSILEKAQVAATMIQPAYTVQYLILQDPSKRKGPTSLGDIDSNNATTLHPCTTTKYSTVNHEF